MQRRKRTLLPAIPLLFWAARPRDMSAMTAEELNAALGGERVRRGTVYTVEGNVGDSCVQGQYYIGAPEILGYGVPIC